MIVQDAGFSADGRREDAQRGFAGRLGDELLVNGTRGPYLDVHDELVRLRLLNASTARSYAFGWSDEPPDRAHRDRRRSARVIRRTRPRAALARRTRRGARAGRAGGAADPAVGDDGRARA